MNLSDAEWQNELEKLLKLRADLARQEIAINDAIDAFHAKTDRVFFMQGEVRQLTEPRLTGLIIKLQQLIGPKEVQDANEAYHG